MAGHIDPDPAGPPVPLLTMRFRDSNVASWEEQHSKFSQGKLRSAVYKVIRQNREKRLSRTNFPGSRFRSVVEEVVRQKNTYKYQPIDYHNEIRILRLHRGKKGDVLKCTFFSSSLPSTRSTSKSECYEYWALSHSWGDPIVTDQLTVYDMEVRDGLHTTRSSKPYSLYLSANLAAALQNIRQENENVNLWVDAVCINQADVRARNAQVALMHRICTEATSVRVWLGDRSLDASLAFDLLKSLANLRTQDELPDIKAKGEIWKSVINLTKQGYWTRVWAFQEFALGKDVQIMWGSETIKSEALGRAWSTILARRGQVEPILHEAGLDRFSTQDFFDRITSRIALKSVTSTIQEAWVDQKLNAERETPAAGIHTNDDNVKEVTPPGFRCHICKKEKDTWFELM
jgi:hypothetical protein